MAEQGFFSIGFAGEAGETAEKMIDALSTFCVAITNASGGTADYELVGWADWDGQEGMPVKARVWGDNAGTGPVIEVDAKHILVY
jgi:hypothetical protein